MRLRKVKKTFWELKEKHTSFTTPHAEASDTDSSSNKIFKKYDDTLPLTEQQLVEYLRKVSRVLFERITKDQWEKHEEAVVHYVNLKASIDDYYNENITHIDQTNQLVEASMSSLEKSSSTINDLYKGLEFITQLLQDITNSVKDKPATNKKIKEASETLVKISTQNTEILSSEDTSSIKSMMTKMYNAFRGQFSLASSSSVTLTFALTETLVNVKGENVTHTATKEPPFHIEGETDANIQDKPKEPKEGKGITIDDQAKDQRKVVKASSIICPVPDEPEEIKKAEKKARLNSISKTEVIKVVRREVKKLGIHLKEAITTKAGELFKKAQEAEHEVLKRQHTEKVRKSLKLKKHKYDSYMWTVSSRLKPKPITDIKIHPKTKPVVIIFYKCTDGRNFDVHKPFLFRAFGISELDKLKEIILKKKNTVIDPEIYNQWYRTQMLESFLHLNHTERDEYTKQLRVQERFDLLEAECHVYQAEMETRLNDAEASARLWKKVIIFMIVLFVMFKKL
uniref:Uncharacterized protein n=1 Tax=Tanacetum cinerariifolium TaxID=118510 RepID=A0A6L2M1S1_TANCI|nr:hypothetical protein [Tanacetum cinerariifolium]